MSLRAAATAAKPKTGRRSSFAAFRDGLTVKQRRDLDGVLADRTFSDEVVARVIEDEYAVRFHQSTVLNYRKANRLR